MSPGWGLYVHIPFCQARCTYCDFNTVTGMGEDMHLRYTQALVEEWRSESLPQGSLASLYFGGGTPSLVAPDLLARVIDAVAARVAVTPSVEITVETNPGTVDRDKLARLLASGVNRLSIGAQALQNHHLAALNRIHDVQSIKDTVKLAREVGFTNISLDAIYGIPEQSLEEWQETVNGLLALNPDHLSLYALIVEDGTPLKKSLQRGLQHLPAADVVAEMADWAEVRLEREGLNAYEISNYSRPGYTSRHNQLYWQLEPYVAVGAGAHAYVAGRRSWNVRGVRRYVELVETGQEPQDDHEDLTEAEEMREFVWLGLRQRIGVDVARFVRRFGSHPGDIFARTWAHLQQLGLVQCTDAQIALTARGRDMANVVARALVDAPIDLPKRAVKPRTSTLGI